MGRQEVEEEVDGRGKLFGMFLLAIDKCGVVEGSGPGESLCIAMCVQSTAQIT